MVSSGWTGTLDSRACRLYLICSRLSLHNVNIVLQLSWDPASIPAVLLFCALARGKDYTEMKKQSLQRQVQKKALTQEFREMSRHPNIKLCSSSNFSSAISGKCHRMCEWRDLQKAHVTQRNKGECLKWGP